MRNKLKEARSERQLTQRELAEILKIKSNSYISRIENGSVRPRVDMARRIALALGKKVEDIFLP